MAKVILHITHTDVQNDSRILKELSALSESPGYELYAIGVNHGENGASVESIQNATTSSIKLLTSWSMRLPRPVLYAFNGAELTIRLWLRGVKLKPHVVHCHDAMVLLAGVLIKMVTGSKLIYDAHELESDKNGQSAALSRATLLIERLSWRCIDSFISVSPSIIKWYEKNLGVKPATLVHNAPIIDEYYHHEIPVGVAAGKYFHSLYSFPKDRMVFIYVGLLVPGRGIEILLDVFISEHVKSHVVFVGYGALRDKVAKCAEKSEKIHLHEPISHERVVPLVREADVGLCMIENVSLSSYYCLPNKLFEYIFAGIPVLASRFPDIEEIVVHRGLGWCTDVDSKSIEMEVRKIEVSKPSHVSVDIKDLSWNTQAEKIQRMYSQMLSGVHSK